MTLDEAIKHAEEEAERKEADAKYYTISRPDKEMYEASKLCAEEHRQLAEWLKELKELRNKKKWIPVSEMLPEDGEVILFSTKTDRVFEGRYFDDDTNNQWYSFRDVAFAWNNVVTAWMPLPEPYVPDINVGNKAESEKEK